MGAKCLVLNKVRRISVSKFLNEQRNITFFLIFVLRQCCEGGTGKQKFK